MCAHLLKDVCCSGVYGKGRRWVIHCQHEVVDPPKREVFWPPVKSNLIFNKLVCKLDQEISSDWMLYNVARVFYETDDYERAKEKLKRAEVTSDIQQYNNSSSDSELITVKYFIQHFNGPLP